MSKKLNKLVDINGLREFKNKLVGTDSAYVQTGAVDQTVGGTKTFLKPIVGSVTGSSGSCTGNAATATRADSAANADTATNANYANSAGSAGSVAWDNVSGKPSAFTPYFANNTWYNVGDDAAIGDHNVGGGLGVKALNSTTTRIDFCYKDDASNYKSITYDGTTLYMNGNCDYATNSGYTNWLRTSSHSDYLFHTEWDGSYFWTYVTAGDGGYRAVRVERSNSSGYADSAGSATKLAAARTIALSGAATGTATGFDGSGDITIPVTALAASAIRAQWYAAFPDGAEAHNAMWGGRDITAAFNAGTVSEHIADGTFKDIFPGDYITKQVTISGTAYNVNWVVADCDYWWHKGDQNSGMETHHVVIVPQASIFSANMNDTNTTEGGYAGSRMYRETIPACATGIVGAFGSDHILTFRDCATNNMNASATSPGLSGWFTGVAQGVAWADMRCNLMSEGMVYGNSIWSSSGDDNCIGLRQMSAFRLSERLINYNRQWWWLRNVVSSTSFALVYGGGIASPNVASYVLGVRPFALLK